MNTPLTVEDPLAGQEVTIVVTLVAGEGAREARPVLVSVGVAERPPALTTGLFGQLPDLIDTAWNAYGLQAQLAAAAMTETAEATLVAEEEVDGSAETPAETALAAAPPAVPRPQAQNLSWF